IKVDKRLFLALAQFWNPAYSCFTFGNINLVPTIEEYVALLRCLKTLVDKVYSKAVNAPTFLKRLMNITGMRSYSSAPRCEEENKCFCSKYIWSGCVP
ncbi:hypothetical protein Golax_000027, partial [Gossypium laxum]|nr:hypothetical protein [Gossypium laxum]